MAPPAPRDLESEVMTSVTNERVRRALAALSDGEREAITLAYFGGYSYREVAEQLGAPEGTIKSRIRMGMQRLKGELTAVGIAGS